MSFDENRKDGDVTGLAAEALHFVNRLAHELGRDSTVRRRIFAAKDDLLSLILELPIPGVRASWQRQPKGDPLLVISLGNRRAFHCPFRGLSWNAQCKIVQRIGPIPNE